MRTHVTIAGGGRVGRRTAEIVSDYGPAVTVIEQDADRCDALDGGRIGAVIHGDATRPSVLEQAAIGRADVFAALTGDGGTNLSLCATVRDMTDDVRTVARIDEDTTDTDLADRIVYPEAAGAKAAADEILDRYVRPFRAAAEDIDVIEIELDPRAPIAEKRLADVALPDRSRIIADADRGQVANARTELRPGHRYIVAIEPDVATEVQRLFRG